MATGVTPHRRPVVASATEVSDAGGALQGTTGIEVAGADPRLANSDGNMLWDLVVHGAGADVSGVQLQVMRP
jgi:hypothetical protein